MYFIIIRGPAGVGKSTIANDLSKILKVKHLHYYSDNIHFDKLMKKHRLDTIEGDGISAENFIKANNLVLNKAISHLNKNKIVIFDGCFYRKEQIEHLLKNLPYDYYIFSLNASVDVCLERNRTRKKDVSDKDIRKVHNLVSKHECGIIVDTNNKTKEQIIKEILSHLPHKN